MLVRPGTERGFDVLMVRRSGASHFVPDAYVFPGGTVDSSDYEEQTLARVRGVDEADLRREFRMQHAPNFAAPVDPVTPRDAQALMVAALRELYEEAGVLLACDEHLQPLDLPVAHETRIPFAQMLQRYDAFADARTLALFSHWITPPTYPRRYNAHFFLARAGVGQTASADAVETHDGVWIAPARALQESELGRFSLVYPTIKHLERLTAFRSIDDLLQFARSKPIYSIMPDTQAQAEFSMPPDLEMSW